MSMIVRYFNICWDQPLGAGGEGRVYLAYSATTRRRYAVKFHNALIPAVAQMCASRELMRVLRVRGDYVARPVAWNLGLQPFIVMELAEFGSLRDEMDGLFRKGKVYHPRFALERVYKMLLGIRDAHRAGLVHRDVKPDNYLKYANDVLKLNDFGVGRTWGRVSAMPSSGFVGTPTYSAPEQRLGYAVDGRADLYSVGVVLYEMLMGRPPTPNRYVPPSARYSNVLPSLDALCGRLLAWNREYRPYSVDAAMFQVGTVWREYDRLNRLYTTLGLNSSY